MYKGAKEREIVELERKIESPQAQKWAFNLDKMGR